MIQVKNSYRPRYLPSGLCTKKKSWSCFCPTAQGWQGLQKLLQKKRDCRFAVCPQPCIPDSPCELSLKAKTNTKQKSLPDLAVGTGSALCWCCFNLVAIPGIPMWDPYFVLVLRICSLLEQVQSNPIATSPRHFFFNMTRHLLPLPDFSVPPAACLFLFAPCFYLPWYPLVPPLSHPLWLPSSGLSHFYLWIPISTQTLMPFQDLSVS